MFTGIVEEVGEVRTVTEDADIVRLAIAGPLVASDIRRGDSLAVNGVCLTAVRVAEAEVEVELVPETLKRSSLSSATAGAKVNLERAIASGQRFGGHIMQGHVDGTSSVISHTAGERSAQMRFTLADELVRYVVEKGSIAVDGVSLTVASVDRDGFEVALIPTTLADTTLGALQPGNQVNIEVDMVAKYVERMVTGYLPALRGLATPASGARTEEGGAVSR